MNSEKNTTIVTAYFKLPKSKQPHSTYIEWMQNMLMIQSPMLIFCDEESLPEIQNFRGTIFPTKIIVMSFSDFFSYRYFPIFENDYVFKDHERYHDPYLYLIWNEKSHFLKIAAENNFFLTDYFLWVDIGCFRIPNTKYIHWPDSSKFPLDKILQLLVRPFTTEESKCVSLETLPDFKYSHGRIGGTIFGGNIQSILKWHDVYYNMLEYFISIDRFIGKDQNIMTSVSLVHPDIVHVVNPILGCRDIWFSLQEYLSL